MITAHLPQSATMLDGVKSKEICTEKFSVLTFDKEIYFKVT